MFSWYQNEISEATFAIEWKNRLEFKYVCTVIVLYQFPFLIDIASLRPSSELIWTVPSADVTQKSIETLYAKPNKLSISGQSFSVLRSQFTHTYFTSLMRFVMVHSRFLCARYLIFRLQKSPPTCLSGDDAGYFSHDCEVHHPKCIALIDHQRTTILILQSSWIQNLFLQKTFYSIWYFTENFRFFHWLTKSESINRKFLYPHCTYRIPKFQMWKQVSDHSLEY